HTLNIPPLLSAALTDAAPPLVFFDGWSLPSFCCRFAWACWLVTTTEVRVRSLILHLVMLLVQRMLAKPQLPCSPVPRPPARASVLWSRLCCTVWSPVPDVSRRNNGWLVYSIG